MSGWKSTYDKEEDQSNFDKLCGRQLHVQDNYWKAAKILGPIFALITFYILVSSGDLFFGIKYFLNLFR